MAAKLVCTKFNFYRNLPIIDQVKRDADGNKIAFFRRLFPFHYQRLRRSFYIEIPFIGCYINRIYEE